MEILGKASQIRASYQLTSHKTCTNSTSTAPLQGFIRRCIIFDTARNSALLVTKVVMDRIDQVRKQLVKLQNEPLKDYLVFVTDGKNRDQTNQTEEYLRSLIGNENVGPPFIWDDDLRYWLCNSRFSCHRFYFMTFEFRRNCLNSHTCYSDDRSD